MAATTHRSVRSALARMRVSFFISVALVPTLLSLVLEGIGHLLAWWQWSLLLTAPVAGFFLLSLRTERLRHRDTVGLPTSVREVQTLEKITDLVITVNLAGGEQNLHTLVPRLPQLRAVHAVAGAAGNPTAPPTAADDATLRDMLAAVGRDDVRGQVLMFLPPFDVDQLAIDLLATRLHHLDVARGTGGVLAVDLTGGTVPMSLAVYLAAARVGVPALYTSSTPPRRTGDPRHVGAVVAVHDPGSILTAASNR
jgi:hypothetical protein